MNFSDILNKSTTINESFNSLNNRRLEKEEIEILLNQISEYGNHANVMYGDSRLHEIIEQLGIMIENTEILTLQETDDWMDKVSVSRDMKSLKDNYKLMQKTAKELHPLQERLSNCYDSIGVLLDRYYKIGEEN